MKKGIKVLSMVFIVGIMITIGVAGKGMLEVEPVMANTEGSNINTITVRGEGTLKVKPDIAYITMGVRTENKDAKVAQTDNANKMDAVLAALKKLGIDEKDIQTTNYSIYPRYDYQEKGAERIKGYTVDNSVEVTLRDLMIVGDVLDIGVENGANVSNGIQFSVADTQEYYQEALKEAVKNAKGKAQAVAETIGVTINNPSSVVEQSTGGNSVIYAEKTMQADSVQNTSTPISTGELDIRASVEVNYNY